MAGEQPLYLGFDLSTQQLKAIIVQSDLHVVAEAKVDFDADFGGKYNVRKGVLVNDDEGEVFAPVAMWLESVDLVLTRLRDDKNAPLARVRGLSGSGQQHGSVYWAAGAADLLASLSPDRPLVEQLCGDDNNGKAGNGAFSHPYAPNWQDHSTQHECDEFDAYLGSTVHLAETTGSAAHHRFTGPQIMRLRRKLPDVYAATSRISLVSSFLASVFLGAVAPMDVSDVCGMNLWDIPTNKWSEPLLGLTAGKGGASALREKLGEVRLDGGGSMGSISGYFVGRYGFDASCQVVPFTGDNPATILSLPLRPLDAIVSLGTSSTFLMGTPIYKPDPSYHFFNHPTTPGQYMFMLCYKNGGLAREKIRDVLAPPPAGTTDPWATFNKLIETSQPLDVKGDSDRAKLGLYFPLPEIVPNIQAGTWRYTCARDGSDLRPAAEDAGSAGSASWPPETDARIIVESQALSMRLRSQNLVHSPPIDENATNGDAKKQQLPAQPRRVYLVGGGSLNPAIASVLGDVLGGADGVYRLDVGGSACALGGAYKAVWALERRDEAETFDDLIGRRWRAEDNVQRVGDGYNHGVFQRYGDVLAAFGEMEQRILKVARNT